MVIYQCDICGKDNEAISDVVFLSVEIGYTPHSPMLNPGEAMMCHDCWKKLGAAGRGDAMMAFLIEKLRIRIDWERNANA